MTLKVSLFERLLADSFQELPAIVREVHDGRASKRLRGQSEVERGSHWLVSMLAPLASLPPSGKGLTTTVTIDAGNSGETWTREFGRHRMRSRLSQSGSVLSENLGPVTLRFNLFVRDQCIEWRVVGARFLGIPLPRKWFVMTSATERVIDGRYTFEVEAGMPLIGSLIRYRGWLSE